MLDYIKRFIIACIMGLCVSLLFLGGNMEQTEEKTNVYEGTR